MPLFVKKPIVVEAVQWTGENFTEMHMFTGFRTIEGEHEAQVFNRIGTYLLDYLHPGATAELWVEANGTNLPLETGEWVIKDSLGFYPCKEAKFAETYEPYSDETPRKG